MKNEDINNLKKFYSDLQWSVKNFSEELMNTNLLTMLNNEKKLPNEFNCDKKALDKILQKLESLRQDTNKILSKLCIEEVKRREEDNNG